MHLKVITKQSTALNLPLFMCVFMMMHMHVQVCICVHLCVCIMCAHVYIYMCVYIQVFMCVYMYAYISVCMCSCACVCVHVYVCACVWRTELTLHLLFQELSAQLSERVSHWSLRLTNQPRLVGQRAQEICLSRPPKFWDLKVALLGSYAGDENQRQFLMLLCQPLQQLNKLPNHSLVFGFICLFF